MGIPIVNLKQLVATEVDSNVDIVAVNAAQTEIADAVTYVTNKANNITGEVQNGVATLDQHTLDKIAELDAEVVEDKNELELKGDAEVARIDTIADNRLAEYNDNAVGDGSDDPDTGGKLGHFNHNYAVKHSAMQSTYDAYVVIKEEMVADVEQVALDKAQVELLYEDFGTKWLGSKDMDPTTNNAGDPLVEGALYWNNTNDVLMVYSPDLGGWTQGTVTASTLQAIASIDDVRAEIEAVGNEIEDKVYEGGTKSSIEVVADNVASVNTVATDSVAVNTVAGDTLALNEVYNNREEIYAADENATIATTKAAEAGVSAEEALASQIAAENAKTASETAQGLSENAQASAELARDEAQTAQGIAEANSAITTADRLAIEQIYDNFDDRYLGTFNTANEPTLDNDGDALVVGALYWNSDDSHLKFYNGTVWEDPQQAASEAATIATAQAVIATVSEAKAKQWATEITDTEVENGLYSAKHYAEKANVDKMVWKGEWAPGTYEKNDVVRYGTYNYIVLVDSTIEEPSTGLEWEVSMEAAAPHYTFTQEGTELVISSSGYVQFPITEGEW